MKPIVSVLMPVYNAGRYLQQAIESILAQTLKEFELIIVDDGSVDDSGRILESFNDGRIRILTHTSNRGIVKSLNDGIEMCVGAFIARMDADDIALPDRLKKQVAVFDSDETIGVVDSVQLIIGFDNSSLQRYNSPIVTERAIRFTLPKWNCLGHPSVMIKADILRSYKYRSTPYEDYDLWMRMMAAGVRIVKIAEPLLLFREHVSSITAMDNTAARHFHKIIQTKNFYLAELQGRERWSRFNRAVRFWLLRDIAIHWFKKMKRIMGIKTK